MNDSIKRISLDLHNTGSRETVKIKKIDTGRKIYISLVDGGIPYHISEECRAVFTAKKPDGNKIINNCTIEDNVISYKLTEQTATVPGVVSCEIKLYGADDKLITSPKFSIIVDDTVYDEGDETESEGEINALTALISDATEAIQGANAAVGRADTATTNAENATAEANAAATYANETAQDLQEAKESGEFDGVSCTHEWDGTTLKITSDSGTSSADLKGDTGDTGPAGASFLCSTMALPPVDGRRIHFSRIVGTPKVGDLIITTNGNVFTVVSFDSEYARVNWAGLDLSGPAGPAGADGADGTDGEDGYSILYCDRALLPVTTTVTFPYLSGAPKLNDLVISANGYLFKVNRVIDTIAQVESLDCSLTGPAGADGKDGSVIHYINTAIKTVDDPVSNPGSYTTPPKAGDSVITTDYDLYLITAVNAETGIVTTEWMGNIKGSDGKDMSPTICTASGTVPYIPDAAERNILSLTVNDDTEVESVKVLGKNLLYNTLLSATGIGITSNWTAEAQEFVLNTGEAGTTSGGNIILIPKLNLDWTPGETYTFSVRHVGGTATLGEGSGITYAWGLFRSDNLNNPCRGNTSLPQFQDLYNFTFTLPEIAEGVSWALYFQCWRKGTVFNNYRVRIQVERGKKVTDWEAYREETVAFADMQNYELPKGCTNLVPIPSADMTVEYVADTKLYIDRLYSDVKGADGKNGTSCTHSWNGTVLTVTSASGTSSADLKGEKGDSAKTPVFIGSGTFVGADELAISSKLLGAYGMLSILCGPSEVQLTAITVPTFALVGMAKSFDVKGNVVSFRIDGDTLHAGSIDQVDHYVEVYGFC